jgi:phosphoribosylanthranilate isomerase
MDLKIKICGMRVSSNIQALALLPIHYMGFIFYPKSKRYAANTLQVSDIAKLPPSICPVAVFVNESAADMQRICSLHGIKHIQLHGNESIDTCQELNDLGYTLVKVFSVDTQFDFDCLKPFQTYCSFFLFDTKTPEYGGSGMQFDWNILKNYTLPTPYFLSGGIGVKDIDNIIRLNLPNLFALDINSKVEIEPGLKDIETIKEIINKVLIKS